MSLFLVPQLTACAAPAVPPDSAEPKVVLEAYLAALTRGDCATGRQLATETFRAGNGELCGATIVSASQIDGEPARPSADQVTFSMSLTTSGDGGRSMEPGRRTWFYTLARQPNGPWRLVGGGSGP